MTTLTPRRLLVEDFGHRFEELGLPFNLGRVYGLAILAEAPLTQDELAKELGVSQSVVSTVVRSLLRLNLLEKVRPSGSRAAAYRAPTMTAHLIAAATKHRIGTMIGLLEQAEGLDLGPVARQRTAANQAFLRHMHDGVQSLIQDWLRKHPEWA